jgi:hypothetical protein
MYAPWKCFGHSLGAQIGKWKSQSSIGRWFTLRFELHITRKSQTIHMCCRIIIDWFMRHDASGKGEIPTAEYSPYDTLIARMTSPTQAMLRNPTSSVPNKNRNFCAKCPRESPHEVQSPSNYPNEVGHKKDHTNFK